MSSTNYLNAKHGIEILHTTGTTQILAGDVDPSLVGVEASIGSIYMSNSTSGTIYKKSGFDLYDWTPDYNWSSGANNLSTEYPRHYIEQGLHINVNNWGQYVIHDTALEIAGTLEIGTGGMVILT